MGKPNIELNKLIEGVLSQEAPTIVLDNVLTFDQVSKARDELIEEDSKEEVGKINENIRQELERDLSRSKANLETEFASRVANTIIDGSVKEELISGVSGYEHLSYSPMEKFFKIDVVNRAVVKWERAVAWWKYQNERISFSALLEHKSKKPYLIGNYTGDFTDNMKRRFRKAIDSHITKNSDLSSFDLDNVFIELDYDVKRRVGFSLTETDVEHIRSVLRESFNQKKGEFGEEFFQELSEKISQKKLQVTLENGSILDSRLQEEANGLEESLENSRSDLKKFDQPHSFFFNKKDFPVGLFDHNDISYRIQRNSRENISFSTTQIAYAEKLDDFLEENPDFKGFIYFPATLGGQPTLHSQAGANYTSSLEVTSSAKAAAHGSLETSSSHFLFGSHHRAKSDFAAGASVESHGVTKTDTVVFTEDLALYFSALHDNNLLLCRMPTDKISYSSFDPQKESANLPLPALGHVVSNLSGQGVVLGGYVNGSQFDVRQMLLQNKENGPISYNFHIVGEKTKY